MNLIYCSCFKNRDYLVLLDYLLRSISMYANINNDITKILVITSDDFKDDIHRKFTKYNLDGYTYCLDMKTIFSSCCARLFIFNYPDIEEYDKIFYLDCDMIMISDISTLFSISLDDKLYVDTNGTTSNVKFGGCFFNKKHIVNKGFCSGLMLFNNCDVIKTLFSNIINHINQLLSKQKCSNIGDLTDEPDKYKLSKSKCNDQPFINYHAIKDNLVDRTVLSKKVALIIGNKGYNHRTLQSKIIGKMFIHFNEYPGKTYNKKNNAKLCLDLIDDIKNNITNNVDDEIKQDKISSINRINNNINRRRILIRNRRVINRTRNENTNN